MPVLYWSLLAIALAAAELFTGSFWMLMLSCAALVGLLTSTAGMDAPTQFLAAGACTVAGTLLLGVRKRASNRKAQHDPAAQLDVGERIDVSAWLPDGTAQVVYRGALWRAVCAPGAARKTGPHRIVGLDANRIVVAPEPGAAQSDPPLS